MIGLPETVEKHLLFIGRKDAGKSRLIRNFIAEEIAQSGYSLFEAKKVVKLHPYGLNVIIDCEDIETLLTPSNEITSYAENRIASTDFIIVIIDGRCKLTESERGTLSYLNEYKTPFLVAVNKIEFGVNEDLLKDLKSLNVTHFEISCGENVGIDALKARMIRMLP